MSYLLIERKHNNRVRAIPYGRIHPTTDACLGSQRPGRHPGSHHGPSNGPIDGPSGPPGSSPSSALNKASGHNKSSQRLPPQRLASQ